MSENEAQSKLAEFAASGRERPNEQERKAQKLLGATSGVIKSGTPVVVETNRKPKASSENEAQ